MSAPSEIGPSALLVVGRNVTLVGTAALLAKLLGIVEKIALAFYFGTGPAAEAYFVVTGFVVMMGSLARELTATAMSLTPEQWDAAVADGLISTDDARALRDRDRAFFAAERVSAFHQGILRHEQASSPVGWVRRLSALRSAPPAFPAVRRDQ